MKTAISIIAILLLVIGLGWLLTANDLSLTRYFAPKYEQVRRETFEQSKAYRQGSIQELQSMQPVYIEPRIIVSPFPLE